MAPSTQDFSVLNDLTGFTSINGTQITQLTTNARPYSDKGMIVETTDTEVNVPDVPDPLANTNPATEGYTGKFTRYIWRRIPNIDASSQTPVYYIWNESLTSDATYLKWQELFLNVTLSASQVTSGTFAAARYGNNTIPNSALAGGITKAKIDASTRQFLIGNKFNVMDAAYGAVGNGTTDDSAAVQAACNALVAAGGGVLYFPPGYNFYCPTLQAIDGVHTASLYVNNNSATSIPFILEGYGAKLTTNVYRAGGIYRRGVYVKGNFSQVKILGLEFANVATDANLDRGGGGESGMVEFNGTAYTFTDLEVSECKFNNWGMWGVEIYNVGITNNVKVRNNTFLSSVGNDGAAVGVRISNYVTDADVSNNYFNGFTGTSLATATNKFGANGLYDGGLLSYLKLEDNTILNFGYEGIIINFSTGVGYPATTTYPPFNCAIVGNVINGSLPTGATAGGLVGIRCDGPGALISNNTVYDCSSCIISSLASGGSAATQLPGNNQQVSSNRLYLRGGDDSTGIYNGTGSDCVYTGNFIYIPSNSGSAGHPVTGIRFEQTLTSQMLRCVVKDNIIACGTRNASNNAVVGVGFHQGFRDGKVVNNTFINLTNILYAVNPGNPYCDNNTAYNCDVFAAGQYAYVVMGRLTFMFTPTAGTTGWFTLMSDLGYQANTKINVTVPWYYGLAAPAGGIEYTNAIGQRGQQTELIIDAHRDWDNSNADAKITLVSNYTNRITGGTITAFRAVDNRLDFYLAAATEPYAITVVLENYTPQVNANLKSTVASAATTYNASVTLVDSPNLTTTDATLTTIATFVPQIKGQIYVEAEVTAMKSDYLVGARFRFGATFSVTAAGAVAQIGTTTKIIEHETGATDLSISTDATNIQVKVTGIAATTLVWKAVVTAVGRH